MRPGNPTAAHAAFQVKGTYEYHLAGATLSLCVLDLIAPQQRQSAPLGDSLLGLAGELRPARRTGSAVARPTSNSSVSEASSRSRPFSSLRLAKS
jgi:hypothetical protein